MVSKSQQSCGTWNADARISIHVSILFAHSRFFVLESNANTSHPKSFDLPYSSGLQC